jgi:hypothetical protein
MITIKDNLQNLINRIDKFPMELESSVAEALMLSEQGIKDSILSEYSDIFQNYEFELSSDLSIKLLLDSGDVLHFENATGSSIDDLVQPITNIVNDNMRQSIFKCMGVSFGS